jgi:hypothetical protein
VSVDGRAVLVAGFTGSGKSAWVIRQTRAAPRLLVWDSMGEWSRRALVQPLGTLPAVAEAIRTDIARGGGRLRVGYTGPVTRAGFEGFCRLAWVWLRLRAGSVLVIEELADVTSPGKAPAAWGEIVRKGRHVGAQVYALTQRPAESDKTIVSNAAAIHSGFMGFPDDRAYMARCLDVPLRDVERLRPLDWIERDMRTRALTRGRLVFPVRGATR